MTQEKNIIVYTHDDVLRMMGTFHTSQINIDLCMCKLTPIELPTKEDIENKIESLRGWVLIEKDFFERGASWMRNQILNKIK